MNTSVTLSGQLVIQHGGYYDYLCACKLLHGSEKDGKLCSGVEDTVSTLSLDCPVDASNSLFYQATMMSLFYLCVSPLQNKKFATAYMV